MPTLAFEKETRNKVVLTTLAIAGALLIGKLGSTAQIPVIAVIMAFFFAMNLAFIRGSDGLYLIVFAILFSPEIGPGAGTGEGKGGMILRLEDIILIAVVIGWILRSAYMGRHFGIIKTPVNSAIWIYIGVSIIASLQGILLESVKSLFSGLMHNLKYFEYFILFFMILANVRKKEIVIHMIEAILIAFFLVMIYGYTQIGSGARICAPFDKEPNTFGGYIVLIMCIAGGIALVDKRIHIKILMVFLLLFAMPPLLFTLSRSSYIAFIAALFSFLVISQHRVLITSIFLALILTMMMGLPLMPEKIQERVTGTFERGSQYNVQIAGVDLDPSASARIISYQDAIKIWIKRPILGYGVMGTHFIDGQYFRILAETGIIGLISFIFMMWRLLRSVFQTYKITTTPFLKGASMGFFCGIIAILVHCIGTNSFIIVRIAEPLWLLAGLVLLIPRLEESEQQTLALATGQAPAIPSSTQTT